MKRTYISYAAIVFAAILILITILSIRVLPMFLPNEMRIEFPWNTDSDFVVDSDGNLYIFSEWDRILKYNSKGEIVSSIEFETKFQSHKMAIDHNGNLYIDSVGPVLKLEKNTTSFKHIELPENQNSALMLAEKNTTYIETNFYSKYKNIICQGRNRKIIKPGEPIFFYHKSCDSIIKKIDTPFKDLDGNTYKYDGFFQGIVKRAPNGEVLQKFNVSWFLLIFQMPFTMFLIVGAFLLAVLIKPKILKKKQ